MYILLKFQEQIKINNQKEIRIHCISEKTENSPKRLPLLICQNSLLHLHVV